LASKKSRTRFVVVLMVLPPVGSAYANIAPAQPAADQWSELDDQ
jgi:hypothetical protein